MALTKAHNRMIDGAAVSNLTGTTMEVMASATAGATPSNPANVFGDGARLDFSIAYRAS